MGAMGRESVTATKEFCAELAVLGVPHSVRHGPWCNALGMVVLVTQSMLCSGQETCKRNAMQSKAELS